MGSLQNLQERFQKAEMTEDLFFGCFMRDAEIFSLILQIITKDPDLYVDEVEMQHILTNVGGRGCRLDAFGKNKRTGMKVNVEMQCLNNDDHVKRVRYYAGSIDTESLPTSAKFKELPDLYLIFITRSDFIKGKSAIYVVERRAITYDKREFPIENGIYEIYINLDENCLAGENHLSMLLDFFRNPREVKGDTEWLRKLKDRYEVIKEGKDVETMAQAGSIMEEYAEEYAKEVSINLLALMLEQGSPAEMVIMYAQRALHISMEEAQDLVDRAVLLNKKNAAENALTLNELQGKLSQKDDR